MGVLPSKMKLQEIRTAVNETFRPDVFLSNTTKAALFKIGNICYDVHALELHISAESRQDKRQDKSFKFSQKMHLLANTTYLASVKMDSIFFYDVEALELQISVQSRMA